MARGSSSTLIGVHPAVLDPGDADLLVSGAVSRNPMVGGNVTVNAPNGVIPPEQVNRDGRMFPFV